MPSAAVAVGGLPGGVSASGRGVYPSMHWAGGVSQHALGRGVCIPACTGQGCVYPSMHWAGGCAPVHAGITPREQNSLHMLVKTLPFRNYSCVR